jgi:hypothetical protein
MLVLGKTALPTAAERTRTGERSASIVAPGKGAAAAVAAPKAAAISAPKAPATVANSAVAKNAPTSTPSNGSAGRALTGRDASLARRSGLVQGKRGLQQNSAASAPTPPAANSVATTPAGNSDLTPGRQAAQGMRANRAQNGRGSAAPSRPSGRMRDPQQLNYAPKVADSVTHAGLKVTGVRIGRGTNMTGDEPGAGLPVTGTQYIGTEGGYLPRAGGVKVGAARTAAGLAVTGTQVRSQIRITGDESNPSLRITGESDQELSDDLSPRNEDSSYTSAQFQRQHDPHGHTVFGTNLGRSAASVGSRSRDRGRALEQTLGGLPISGSAVGRSPRVTGDEPGSCRTITGDQYLMGSSGQPLCDAPARKFGRARALAMQNRPDPVTGEKVVVSETWRGQRITGVDVEHNANVSGDEYGVCSSITGTPYVGPAQFDSSCQSGEGEQAEQRVAPAFAPGNRVTGDIPVHGDGVTGTHRGAQRDITGTPYYRTDVKDDATINAIENANRRFSVRSPQREAQLRAGTAAIAAPSAESRVSGSFASGEGKITGNQEFHFRPRRSEEQPARSRLTGEGRIAGPPITSTAWTENKKVTGTEDYIATERNPSERAGKRHAFASAVLFKDKGHHEPPRQLVTGLLGWSAKAAAKVTLSGGAQG